MRITIGRVVDGDLVRNETSITCTRVEAHDTAPAAEDVGGDDDGPELPGWLLIALLWIWRVGSLCLIIVGLATPIRAALGDLPGPMLWLPWSLSMAALVGAAVLTWRYRASSSPASNE